MSNSHCPSIKSLVIPITMGNLIVPNNLMAAMIHIDHQDDIHLVNWLEWHGRRIPLIAIESLCMLDNNYSAQKHCVILHTLLDNDELAFIAIEAKGSPHTLEVSEEALRDDHKKNKQRCPYIASHVRVGNIPCMVPDLPAIETVILEMMQLESDTQEPQTDTKA
jgi:hypothetical protein